MYQGRLGGLVVLHGIGARLFPIWDSVRRYKHKWSWLDLILVDCCTPPRLVLKASLFQLFQADNRSKLLLCMAGLRAMLYTLCYVWSFFRWKLSLYFRKARKLWNPSVAQLILVWLHGWVPLHWTRIKDLLTMRKRRDARNWTRIEPQRSYETGVRERELDIIIQSIFHSDRTSITASCAAPFPFTLNFIGFSFCITIQLYLSIS